LTIVGDVRSGKSSILKCILNHFEGKAAFHELSRNIESEPEFSRSVENFLRRKVDVSKLCSLVNDEDTDTSLPRYVIVDDLDILLAHDSKSILTSTMALMKLGCRFIITLDKDSARKFKLKKESTMVYLDDKLETSDLKKWGKQWFPDAMTDDASEINMCKAMRAAESAKGCMKDMLEHYYTSTTSAIVSPKTTQWERDGNYKSIEKIFTGSLNLDDAYNAAESVGGTMLWQIAWQNSKMFFLKKKTDYYDRMLRMIDGIDLEFQGHMGKDRHVNCIGTAIAITAWSNLSTKVNLSKLEYSKTIGNGGARALDKKNVAAKAIANGVTLCEMSRILSE
jgi:hypothetical protein